MSASALREDPARLLSHALDLASTGRHAQAISLLTSLLPRFPDLEGDIRVCLAHVYEQEGHCEQAVQQAHLAVAATPQSADAHRMLGKQLLSAGQPKQAESHLRTSLALDSQNARTWVILSILLSKTGRYEEAFHTGKQAVYLEPDSAEAHCTVGTSVLEADPRLAEQAAREALRLDPEYAPALRLLAAAQIRQRSAAHRWMHSLARYVASTPQDSETPYLVDLMLAKMLSPIHGGTVVAVLSSFLMVGAVADSDAPRATPTITLLVIAGLTALPLCRRANVLRHNLPYSLGSRLRGLLRRRPLLTLQIILLAGLWGWMATGAGLLLHRGDFDTLSWACLAGLAVCVLSFVLMRRAVRDSANP